MSNIFSIVSHIDTKILDKNIDRWNNTHSESPIILMSPDTLKEIQTIEDLGFCISRSTCSNCGTYHGVKVFSDSSMKYGEVELR